MKTTKLLIVHHSGYIGGAGISLIDIVSSLKHLHLDITVICPDNPTDMKNILHEMGVDVIGVKNVEIFSHFSGSSNFALGFRAIRNVINIIRKQKNLIELIDSIKPDVVFLNSMTLFYLGRILKEHGYKTVCFHRETFANGLFGLRSHYIKKSLGCHFNKIVFISKFDRNESKLPLYKTKVITDKVECNIDISSYSEEVKVDKEKYVLYVGGMVDLKGAHLIVEAFKYLPKSTKLMFLQYDKSNFQTNIFKIQSWKRIVKIILNIDYEFKVSKLIVKYSLLNQVDFYDTDRDVSKYYLASDLVVFPSTKPHQSRIIYEAGVYRKPVIVSDFENTQEFLKNGYNGLTFKANNAFDLSRKILECLSNNELSEDLVENNYNETIANHNLKELKNELKLLLDGLLIENEENAIIK